MKTIILVLVTILIVAVCFTQSILISGSEGDPDQFGEAMVCSKELQDVDASDLRGKGTGKHPLIAVIRHRAASGGPLQEEWSV